MRPVFRNWFQNCLDVGEIQKVLQNLLAEGISIRDLVTIFEHLQIMRTTTHDTDVLTEYVQTEFEAGNFKSVF